MGADRGSWRSWLARALGPPSAPARPPRRRLVSAAAAAVLLAALVTTVALRHGTPFAVDTSLHRWFLARRSPGLTSAARAVTFTGTGTPPYVLAALAGALASRSRVLWWRGALLGVLGLALGEAARVTLATALARPRPPRADWATAAGGSAMPSGHTTTSALVAIALAAALYPWCRRWWTRLPACVLPALWAVGVGFSRVYLGVHWPTDVIAGWFLATALTCALMPRLNTVLRRWSGTVPDAPADEDTAPLPGRLDGPAA